MQQARGSEPFPFIVLSTGARASPFFKTMTALLQDQLLSIVAGFIVEGKPGTTLLLPSLAWLRKRDDGRMLMGRDGSIGSLLFNETSDDIVATIVRWGKEA